MAGRGSSPPYFVAACLTSVYPALLGTSPGERKRSRVIVIFDSECVLCSRWVQFLLRHETRRETRFLSAWSPEGTALAKQHGISQRMLDRTFVVVDGSRALTRSDAALALVNTLEAPWHHLLKLRFVPRPLRDMIYDLVARNRYKWFGRRDCYVPPAQDRERFILASRPAAPPRKLNKRV